MKPRITDCLAVLAAIVIASPIRVDATVTADGVDLIDSASTPASILASVGSVDLALNLGAVSGGSVNGIGFSGAVLTVGNPIVGAGATLTPNAPTPPGTSLRNLDLNGFLWTTSGSFAGLMNDAVDTQRFPAVSGDALNFTISGLDANRFYFIQLLSGDIRSEFENQNYELGGVVQNAQFGNGGANDGVLVKFTATGETSLNLSVSNVTGNSPPMLAGILIRSVEAGLFAPSSAVGTSDGTPDTITFPVGNGASLPYNITGAIFTGPDAADFSSASVLPLAVPAAGSSDFVVNVTPTAGGTRAATVTLLTDDPSAPEIDVPLSVEVADPAIDIDPSLSFGNSTSLTEPVSNVIFVYNDGGATDLTVGSPVISGPGASAFSVTSLPTPIAPGGFDAVEITFDPPANGYFAATLELTSNDPFNTNVIVQLTGEVTGNLILPVSVAGVSSELTAFGRAASNSINGSGLTGLGSAGSSVGIGETNLVWTTSGNIIAPNDLDPQITYDLGGVYRVTAIREWGYNDPTINLVLGTSARIIGPDEVEVFTSTDNVNFTSSGTVNFALAPGTPAYIGSEIPVSLPPARYIRLDIKSNHDGAVFDGSGANPGVADGRSLTGLSEVRFEGTEVSATPFEAWLDSYSIAGADRSADADPDADGTPNLVEFSIGGDPTLSDPEKLPKAEVVGENLVLTFDRPDEAADLLLRFEAGTDLVVWPDVFIVGSSPEIAITPNGTDPDGITLTLPIDGNPMRFVRLVAGETN